MKQVPKKVTEAITVLGLVVQFGMSLFFLRYVLKVPFSELQVSLIALTVAFFAIAITNTYNFTQTKKLNKVEDNQTKILQKLDDIQRQTEHTFTGEALATIVDNLIQRKETQNET